MDASTSGLLKNIADSLKPLEQLNKPFLFSPEFWGSIIASLVALYIAVDQAQLLKRWLGIKPKLEVLDFRRYKQATFYWRLAIKNTGKETARRVQVDATNIFEDGKNRENFLAVPLRWTHLNCESRDILPGQTVYLDTVEHIAIMGKEKAKLITNSGGGVDDFEVLKQGKSKITLTVYEESGISFNKKIEVSWSGGPFFDGRLEGRKWLLTKDGNFIS